MSEHTKEPWRIPEDRQLEIEGEYGDAVARVHGDGGTHDFHDARRIVASVNACKGISTANLEDNDPLVDSVVRLNDLLKQRDEMLAALKDAARWTFATEFGFPILLGETWYASADDGHVFSAKTANDAIDMAMAHTTAEEAAL